MSESAAECGMKCFAERKTCCRDLQRWGKNLLYMIGLEDVAKEFVDPKSWPHISPFLNAEKETQTASDVKDWTATEKCPVCSGRRCGVSGQAESETCPTEAPTRISSSSGIEPTGEATSSTPRLNFDFLFANSSSDQYPNAFSSHMFPQASNPFNFFGFSNQAYMNQLLHWSAAAAMNPSLYSSTAYPAFMDQVVAFQQHASALQQNLAAAQQQSTSGLDLSAEKVGEKKIKRDSSKEKIKTETDSRRHKDDKICDYKSFVKSNEQPLDLSIKHESKRKSSDLVHKNSHSKPALSPSQNGKRNYSQIDLDAAVKDIRSGRLGTRRASVVYGIPRSTLRNKIYKLEAAEENGNGFSLQSAAKKIRRTGVAISTSPLVADTCSKEATSPESRPSSGTRDGPATPQSVSNPVKEESDRMLDWSQQQFLEQQRALMQSLCNQQTTNPYMQMGADAWSSFEKMWAAQMQQTAAQHAASTSKVQEKESIACSMPRRLSTADSVKSQDDNLDESAWNKKTRPKRGQYRKYDKNALQEAVQTVRRGEMSVHRAGSYYGVPHSTLEYKVKERNLMRLKKKTGIKLEEPNGDASECGSSPDRRCKSEMDSCDKGANFENVHDKGMQGGGSVGSGSPGLASPVESPKCESLINNNYNQATAKNEHGEHSCSICPAMRSVHPSHPISSHFPSHPMFHSIPFPSHPISVPSHFRPIPFPSHPISIPSHPIPSHFHPIPFPSHPIPSHPISIPSHPIPSHFHPIPFPSHPIPLPSHPIPFPSHPIPFPSHPIPFHFHPIPFPSHSIVGGLL